MVRETSLLFPADFSFLYKVLKDSEEVKDGRRNDAEDEDVPVRLPVQASENYPRDPTACRKICPKVQHRAKINLVGVEEKDQRLKDQQDDTKGNQTSVLLIHYFILVIARVVIHAHLYAVKLRPVQTRCQ